MNLFNILNGKNNNQNMQNNQNNLNNSYYPETIITKELKSEIKDDKNYKTQENFKSPNHYAENYIKNNSINNQNNYSNNNFNSTSANNNFYQNQNNNNQTNQGGGLFGNLNLQALLPLLIGGQKGNLLETLTNSNPQISSILNLLNGNKKKSDKPTEDSEFEHKKDTSFDMSNFVKVSDYYKK